MDRQQLEALVEQGLSVRGISVRVDLSPTAVRYWLARHGLETARASARRRKVEHLTDTGETYCSRHGIAAHRQRSDAGWVCLQCRSESVARRRRRVKETLVAEAGGCCTLCGYARSSAALVFHHVDPGEKRFGIASGGVTRSLASAREEAAKCLLLCANCHAEVEAGVAVLP